MELGEFNIHQLTKLCETLLDGEPVFIIRAKDIVAPEGVEGYIESSKKAGGLNIIRCRRQLDRIKAWQEQNRNRVKTPD